MVAKASLKTKTSKSKGTKTKISKTKVAKIKTPKANQTKSPRTKIICISHKEDADGISSAALIRQAF